MRLCIFELVVYFTTSSLHEMVNFPSCEYFSPLGKEPMLPILVTYCTVHAECYITIINLEILIAGLLNGNNKLYWKGDWKSQLFADTDNALPFN